METHSCKICGRNFPNGRSLGGHMRSHDMLKSSFNSEENSVNRYVLRENPKKSRRFNEEVEEQEEEDSWSTGVHGDEEEEMEMQTECQFPRGRRQRRRSKRVEAISASSSPAPSSPEYGAMCLMMLSKGAGSVSNSSNEVKRSESNIFSFCLKKVEFFPTKSGIHLDDDVDKFKKDLHFAVLESGERRKTSRGDFDTGLENSSKRSRYECSICNKSFHSYQALGGHCASHKKIRADTSSSSTVAEQLLSQKFRTYKCPICEKVFASGQALGGHKRSHLIAGNAAASAAAVFTDVIEIEKKGLKLNSLDLNLPAPDFGIYDSFNSNGSIEEDKFSAFQGSCRLAPFMI